MKTIVSHEIRNFGPLKKENYSVVKKNMTLFYFKSQANIILFFTIVRT